ncbi:MauE/DoxX family redox-associated membrane protein [Mucilaginibacter sp. CAU 1740]|uniref:MauE/DoxX family redox-associated membrane protein n=1 Tax=Mucilaginibacter sp. CAU 1740 TaxID=3140365 RepID=UPI00325B3BD5
MKKELLYELITGTFVLLFLYTGLSKILDFKNFEVSMWFQHMPRWITLPMIYLLPASEIIVAILLISGKSRIAGLYLFLLMMAGFSLYVGTAMLHLFPKAPCACGGVIKSLGWGPHFILNLLFTGLASLALRHYRHQRRSTRNPKAIQAQNISRARNQVNTGPAVKPLNITK